MIDIQAVKNSADIATIIGEYIRLRKSGSSLVARCPFHNERSPSFYVHQNEGYYKCFGCGAAGDVIDFVQKIESLSFREAVRLVADKSGIRIEDDKPLTKAEKDKYAELMEAREMIRFLSLRDKIPLQYAESEYEWQCCANPKFKAWHKKDWEHANMCGRIIVDMISIAQRGGLQ